jgi:hypothetical protein
MKQLIRVAMMLMSISVMAQTSEKEERIKRDVEVAENVLSTLIRQQMDKRLSFWGFDVKGSYMAGYGVTLRIPNENWIVTGNVAPNMWDSDDVVGSPGGVTIINRNRNHEEAVARDMADLERLRDSKVARRDSNQAAYNDKLLQAAKIFLADYGDLIGLEPNERILITTKSERGGNYAFSFGGDVHYTSPKRRVMSVEAMKSDLTQYKQGKLSREQLFSKFKILNSDVNNESQPDLELLCTIFGRLYRSDLSKTYFMSSAPNYERLKDFGATFYMHVYSSNESGYKRWDMPTVDWEDVSQEQRDAKVKELYPAFEKDMKMNMLEYGRTVNSLKDDELLIFDITLTKCKGCGIPASVEYSVKASVLKEYGQGKLSREVAIAKINAKAGPIQ